jgi:hypothetical protein
MAFQGRGQQGQASQSSEREPADQLRDEFNIIGRWLSSLTSAIMKTILAIFISVLVIFPVSFKRSTALLRWTPIR